MSLRTFRVAALAACILMTWPAFARCVEGSDTPGERPHCRADMFEARGRDPASSLPTDTSGQGASVDELIAPIVQGHEVAQATTAATIEETAHRVRSANASRDLTVDPSRPPLHDASGARRPGAKGCGPVARRRSRKASRRTAPPATAGQGFVGRPSVLSPGAQDVRCACAPLRRIA
jgi:hypothetical protein